MADMIDRYAGQMIPLRPKNAKNHLIHLRWWKEQLGYFLLSDINPAKISECRDLLLKREVRQGETLSPSTANRYLATLSHVFNITLREWQWIEVNPVSRLKKQPEPRGRVRFLDDNERGRLLKACKESDSKLLYPVVILALSTGMRKGEILKIQWKDVDFQRKRVLLLETKNNERRAVPLVGLAYDLLKSLCKVRRLDNPYIFPAKSGKKAANISTAWDSAIRKAGIENFRFHDLRHTAASYLAMNGATLAEIAEVLGHKTLQMVKRYAHLSEAHTIGVVERMNEKIFNN